MDCPLSVYEQVTFSKTNLERCVYHSHISLGSVKAVRYLELWTLSLMRYDMSIN